MSSMMNVAPATKLESGIAKIRERFLLSLEDRADEFYDLLEQLAEPGEEEFACTGIRAKAHKLHGLAGTVGFPRIGALAAQLENHIDLIIAGPRPLEVGFVKELLNALLDEVESHQVDA